MLIHKILLKKTNLNNLASDIDKLEKIPSDLSSKRSNVEELDIDELETNLVVLSKLIDVVKIC